MAVESHHYDQPISDQQIAFRIDTLERRIRQLGNGLANLPAQLGTLERQAEVLRTDIAELKILLSARTQ